MVGSSSTSRNPRIANSSTSRNPRRRLTVAGAAAALAIGASVWLDPVGWREGEDPTASTTPTVIATQDTPAAERDLAHRPLENDGETSPSQGDAPETAPAPEATGTDPAPEATGTDRAPEVTGTDPAPEVTDVTPEPTSVAPPPSSRSVPLTDGPVPGDEEVEDLLDEAADQVVPGTEELDDVDTAPGEEVLADQTAALDALVDEHHTTQPPEVGALQDAVQSQDAPTSPEELDDAAQAEQDRLASELDDLLPEPTP